MADPRPRELEVELRALRELTEERFRAAAEALRLQTLELQRRLDHLNGEAERLAKERATFITRELFESFKKQLVALVVGLLGVLSAFVVYLASVKLS